jgi:hypothetical protein
MRRETSLKPSLLEKNNLSKPHIEESRRITDLLSLVLAVLVKEHSLLNQPVSSAPGTSAEQPSHNSLEIRDMDKFVSSFLWDLQFRH